MGFYLTCVKGSITSPLPHSSVHKGSFSHSINTCVLVERVNEKQANQHKKGYSKYYSRIMRLNFLLQKQLFCYHFLLKEQNRNGHLIL
jgi:hypothetical protein